MIDIPETPVREGYTFKYWKGSEYYPGDRYMVEDDHTFTAVWEPARQDGAGTQGGVYRNGSLDAKSVTRGKTAKTSDTLSPAVIAALAGLSLVSLAAAVVAGKRRRRE